MAFSLCTTLEVSAYHIFKLNCVLEGAHNPQHTSVAVWFVGSAHYLWTIYCVWDGKPESLPGIIWKLWNLPAGKFTAKQLYCWNSDKSTPVYDFENRTRCMQLNILYTVTRPPGGCIIESVYFDWHILFFFSSRHYCCKWYLCSIWIFSSKSWLGIWINIFWTSSFITMLMIFGSNPAIVHHPPNRMQKAVSRPALYLFIRTT